MSIVLDIGLWALDKMGAALGRSELSLSRPVLGAPTSVDDRVNAIRWWHVPVTLHRSWYQREHHPRCRCYLIGHPALEPPPGERMMVVREAMGLEPQEEFDLYPGQTWLVPVVVRADHSL